MNNRFIKLLFAGSLLLALGAGCIAKGGEETTNEKGDASIARTAEGGPDGAVQGESVDGKGPSGINLCISTDDGVAGPVWLYSANAKGPDENWSQWFSAQPVAVGDGTSEMCGALNFLIATGDKIRINGAIMGGQGTLVENKGEKGTGSDLIREIWIDDQYYAVGKECAYVANGKKGFDLECAIR